MVVGSRAPGELVSPETLPIEAIERSRAVSSFDMMASVKMLRADIESHGAILAETMRRVCDEELSLMAEGIDRASKTSFTYQRRDGELVYFSDGAWRPYMSMLTGGLEAARSDASHDPRRQFLVDWAVRDYEKGRAMNALAPGEQMLWWNAYPEEQEHLYGAKFLKECGLSPSRKMGFIYRAACNEDGSVTLESQTVDRSDLDAFETVSAAASCNEKLTMDMARKAYDTALAKKYGDIFYAGRRGVEREENAWTEILKHRDLVEFFIQGLADIANSGAPEHVITKRTHELVIGTWKAFKNRLDNKPAAHVQSGRLAAMPTGANPQMFLRMEVHESYQQARLNNEIKTGCGGAVAAHLDGNQDISGKETFDAIWGGDSEEKYTFNKEMYCVACQAPPKEGEGKKLCGPCGLCRGCDLEAKVRQLSLFALAA